MVDSISNATGVLGALKALQSARTEMSSTEGRVSSGLKVKYASDNANAYQTSSVMQGEANSLKAVSLSLGRAQAVSDVSISAGEQISKLLIEMRGTAATAMGGDLSDQQRQTYNLQFSQQRAQLVQFIQNASFDDANLLDGSKPNGITFIADAEASQTVTLTGRNFMPGTPVMTLSNANDLSTPAGAAATYEALGQSISNVGVQLQQMTAEGKRIQAQIGFVSKLADALAAGVGRLVDTDLPADSAMIQALQVKQSLSAQAINIANTAPQALLALFRP